jgi:uncharacterized membrane protein (Fun14 family)
MVDDIPFQASWGAVHRLFFNHVATMPAWHKLVLLIGMVMALGGGAGQLLSAVAGGSNLHPDSAVSTPASPSLHGGSSPTTAEPAPYPFLGRFSPHSTRIGVSLVGGFIVGWLCRAFLKTMAIVILCFLGVMLLLSRVGILNLDFSTARHEYAGAMHWLFVQTRLVKDVILVHFPSAGGGTFGAFLGFRRRWGGRF